MYENNFLDKVILRVDYNIERSDINKDFLEKLHNLIKTKYHDTELDIKTIKKISAKLQDENISFESVGHAGIYNFNSNKDKFAVDFMSFSLETTEYEKFDLFFEKFKFLYEMMQSINKCEEFKRVGLRFINILEDESINGISGVEKFIKKDFLPEYNKLKLLPNKFSLRRNMNEFIFGNGDYKIRLYLGKWNQNYPSIISDNEYIVDIDCSLESVLDNDDITSKPPEMSNYTYEVFEFLITENFKEILKKVVESV